MYIGERLKEIRKEWENDTKTQVTFFNEQYKRWPQLSIVLATDDAASLSYVKAKMNKLQSLGIETNIFCLPIDCSFTYAEERVQSITRQSHSVIIQSPTHFSQEETQALMNLIPYAKDADRLSYSAFGQMIHADRPYDYPATVHGIITIINNIINANDDDLTRGMNAVVIGRGQLVGTPAAIALRDYFNASVTEFHSYSKDSDIRDACYDADIIISASNSYLTVLENQDFKKDQVLIIDAATIADQSGKIKGSIPESVGRKPNTLVTPVPGGVGPFTVLGLANNAVHLSFQHYKEA